MGTPPCWDYHENTDQWNSGFSHCESQPGRKKLTSIFIWKKPCKYDQSALSLSLTDAIQWLLDLRTMAVISSSPSNWQASGAPGLSSRYMVLLVATWQILRPKRQHLTGCQIYKQQSLTSYKIASLEIHAKSTSSIIWTCVMLAPHILVMMIMWGCLMMSG